MTKSLTLQHIITNVTALLAELSAQQAILRDLVRGVARRYDTGLYLHGRPGTAKTHTVRAVLEEEIREIYAYQRGHVTPVGLFELIAEHPDEVIVLDDLVTIFRNDIALQILLSALEHPSPGDRTRTRIVKYRRKGEEVRTAFRGGIICISNRELHDDELLGAFKSRVHTLNYDPSDAQLGALMLDLAGRGRLPVPPEEAGMVARFVIEAMLRNESRFDLRLLINKAIPDYIQWKDGQTESHWRALVNAGIEQHVVAVPHSGKRLSRAGRKEEEHALIRQIERDHPSKAARVRAWSQLTGKSSRAYRRRQNEMR